MEWKEICAKATLVACACAVCFQLARPLVTHDAPVDLARPAVRALPASQPDTVYPRPSALQMLQRGIVASTNYDGGGIVKMHDQLTGSSFSAVPNYVHRPIFADLSTSVSAY